MPASVTLPRQRKTSSQTGAVSELGRQKARTSSCKSNPRSRRTHVPILRRTVKASLASGHTELANRRLDPEKTRLPLSVGCPLTVTAEDVSSCTENLQTLSALELRRTAGQLSVAPKAPDAAVLWQAVLECNAVPSDMLALLLLGIYTCCMHGGIRLCVAVREELTPGGRWRSCAFASGACLGHIPRRIPAIIINHLSW